MRLKVAYIKEKTWVWYKSGKEILDQKFQVAHLAEDGTFCTPPQPSEIWSNFSSSPNGNVQK